MRHRKSRKQFYGQVFHTAAVGPAPSMLVPYRHSRAQDLLPAWADDGGVRRGPLAHSGEDAMLVRGTRRSRAQEATEGWLMDGGARRSPVRPPTPDDEEGSVPPYRRSRGAQESGILGQGRLKRIPPHGEVTILEQPGNPPYRQVKRPEQGPPVAAGSVQRWQPPLPDEFPPPPRRGRVVNSPVPAQLLVPGCLWRGRYGPSEAQPEDIQIIARRLSAAPLEVVCRLFEGLVLRHGPPLPPGRHGCPPPRRRTESADSRAPRREAATARPRRRDDGDSRPPRLDQC